MKGLVTRNTHVKYESLICCGSRVMTKVKVFVYGRRRRQQRRRRGYDNSSPDFRHGELKMKPTMHIFFKFETYDESVFAWFLGGQVLKTSGLYPILEEGIKCSNRKGDSFIFREKLSSRRETLKQPKICEILSRGVRYGNYVCFSRSPNQYC